MTDKKYKNLEELLMPLQGASEARFLSYDDTQEDQTLMKLSQIYHPEHPLTPEILKGGQFKRKDKGDNDVLDSEGEPRTDYIRPKTVADKKRLGQGLLQDAYTQTAKYFEDDEKKQEALDYLVEKQGGLGEDLLVGFLADIYTPTKPKKGEEKKELSELEKLILEYKQWRKAKSAGPSAVEALVQKELYTQAKAGSGYHAVLAEWANGSPGDYQAHADSKLYVLREMIKAKFKKTQIKRKKDGTIIKDKETQKPVIEEVFDVNKFKAYTKAYMDSTEEKTGELYTDLALLGAGYDIGERELKYQKKKAA